MRALIMGDAHIGKTIRGRSRLEEHRTVLDTFVSAVDAHRATLVILPGDTFDSARPGPDELQLFGGFLRRLRERQVTVLITPGNHDGPTTLRSVEGKVTSWLGALPLERVWALSDPASIMFGDDILFFTLPYPHKRSMDALLDKSLRDRTEEVSRALENIIEVEHDRLAELHPGASLYFVGHLSVLNAQLSEDQAMRLGWDVTIRPDVLAPFQAAFLGHIHRAQPVIEGHSYYSGSPIYSDFGETTQQKGFLLFEDESEGPLGPQRFTMLPSDCRPMTRWDLYESNDFEVDDWTGTDGYVQVRLFPDKGGTPTWALKRHIKGQFTDAAGVWVDVMPRPQANRVRLDPATKTTEPDDVLRSYIKLHDLPEQPTLDVARSIMATVDES